MRSTFMGLETALRGLNAQQASLQTTSHNISNANTAGYSRQVVNMQATRPLEAIGLMRSAVPGQIGTGVEFNSITRIREQFLDDQYRNENKALGQWSIQTDTLEKLETIMNEPTNTGLRTVLDNFWKSWSDLSKDPENVTGRKIVRENANALADAFNFTSKQLKDLSGDLTSNVSVKADQMNSITSTIANLNDQIQRIEALGDDANDLRDQRDLLTDDLSKVVNITVQKTAQGYSINMGNTNLVSGVNSTKVDAASLTASYASGDLNEGEVYGMITSRDKFVADYQKQLDTMANSIANGDITVTIPAGSILPEGTVLNNTTYSGANRTLGADLTVTVKGLNGLHKLGYTFSSTTGAVVAGGDFFTAKSGYSTITAESFSLSPLIANNPSNIATSLRTIGTGNNEAVVNGNNTLALLISQLKDTSFTFGQSGSGAVMAKGTVDDFFRSIVGQLGVQSKDSSRQLDNQKALVDQIESRRQSVSGVSLDEEMSNLIKFQHAYTASSRVMTTFDQLLDKIINSMGVVGR